MPEQIGRTVTIIDPDTGDPVAAAINSSGMMEVLRDAVGAPYQMASRLDPAKAKALMEYAGIEEKMSALKGQVSDYDMQKLKNLKGRILERRKPPGPMQKSEMHARARMGQSKEEIESDAIKKSYETVGTGGYIIEHANGALEWVPNGPGDQPQPPTGDVFYDPIALEQEQVNFARGGAVRKFQSGGLAEVVGPPEEEEEAITSEQLVERATNPAAGQSLSEMILSNKQGAIDRLRATRENLSSRRDDARKREQQDKWLAMAQAMLSPTKTGAFGENVGMAAGALRDERARGADAEAAYDEQLMNMVAAETAMENEAIDQMLELAGHADAGKAIHGAIQTMVHPADMKKTVENQRIVFGAMQVDPEAPELGLQLTPLQGADGTMFEAASKLDPARASALIRAAERAQASTGRSEDFINEAYTRKAPLVNIREVNRLLENADVEIKTSGVQHLKNRLANWLGVDFGDTVELTEIQMRVAQDYLDKLAELKGPASDKDLAEMKGISVGMGQNTTANYRMLKQMESIYVNAIRTGIREAYNAAQGSTSPLEKRTYMDNVADLWESVGGFAFDRDAEFLSTKEQYDKLKPGTKFYRVDHWGSPFGQKPFPTEEE